jgi:hypothetical protein
MVGDPKTSQPHRKRVQPVLRLQGGSRSSLGGSQSCRGKLGPRRTVCLVRYMKCDEVG